MGNFNMEQMHYPIIANQIRVRDARPLEPERLLWYMVVREAVQCYQGNAIVETEVGRRDREKEDERKRAKRWFRSNRRDVGSFLFCAKVLDLDVEAFRKGLENCRKITLHRQEYGKGVRKCQKEKASRRRAQLPDKSGTTSKSKESGTGRSIKVLDLSQVCPTSSGSSVVDFSLSR